MNKIRLTFQVIVKESASPKLLKGTKDLFPCVMRQRVKKMGTVSFVRDWADKDTDFELEVDDGGHELVE